MINEIVSSESNSGFNAALQAGTRLSLKAHTKSQGHEAGKGNLSRTSGEEEEQMWAGTGREASGWELEESRVRGWSNADCLHARLLQGHPLAPLSCKHIR